MAVRTSPEIEGWRTRSPWVGFLVRRVVRLGGSLFALATLSFLMIHMIPGDPIRTALGPLAPLELIRAREHALWLDRPLADQYVHYMTGLLSGDLGTSFVYNLPVADIIGGRLANSAMLAGVAFLVIMLLAVPLGMAAAVLTRDGRRRGTELTFTSVTGLLATIPEFLLGVGLVVLFAVQLKWLPVAGQAGPESYVLPVAALSAGSVAVLARIVRAETLKVLGEDYVRVARSKWLPARLLYMRHVLPNMLTATLTMGGLMLTGLIGGTVLVENVFAWQGIGTVAVHSVAQRDYPVAQAVIMVLGTAVLVVNLVVDVLLGLLDPRSTVRGT